MYSKNYFLSTISLQKKYMGWFLLVCLGLCVTPTIAKEASTSSITKNMTLSSPMRVLVAHPVVYGLAQQLTRSTAIQIVQVVPPKLPASRQPSYLMGRGLDKLLEQSKQASAALTMRSIWSDDMLYPLARRGNIRLVEIDVAQPVEQSTSGIALSTDEKALVERPWLNSGNMLRMSSIMADAFIRLYPNQKKPVEANLKKIKKRINALNAQATLGLAKAKDVSAIAIADNTKTFAIANNLDVIPWSVPKKRKNLAEQLPIILQKEKVKIVLTNRKPKEKLLQTIQASGASVVVVPRFYGDPIEQLEKASNQLLEAVSR